MTKNLRKLPHVANIERFRKEQLLAREWINFAEIAEWCSNEDGSIISDEKKRAAAFDKLTHNLLAGDFKEDGKSVVLFLLRGSKKKLMTADWLRDAINGNWDGAKGRSGFLPYCWIPRQMFDAWLGKHRLEPPAWLACWRLSRSRSRSGSTRHRGHSPSLGRS